MNLDLINKYCWDWDKQTWQEAYNEYCKTNMFGIKTKKEFYIMVTNNHKRLLENTAPLSEELRNTWANGWKNAVVWAKKHKCNINGESLEKSRPEINLESLQNNVREIQWQLAQK